MGIAVDILNFASLSCKGQVTGRHLGCLTVKTRERLRIGSRSILSINVSAGFGASCPVNSAEFGPIGTITVRSGGNSASTCSPFPCGKEASCLISTHTAIHTSPANSTRWTMTPERVRDGSGQSSFWSRLSPSLRLDSQAARWKRLLLRLRRRQPRRLRTNSRGTKWTGGGRLAAALFLASLASPAAAQIIPFADIAGYKIARVQSQGICFAALETRSLGSQAMVYTYYQRATGQRWHVAGFGSSEELPNGEVAVEVSIDGEVTLSRSTEARDGDFMLPFEALAEITAHEALIETGDQMTISVNKGSDKLAIGLADHRAALGAIQACLSAL